MLICAIVRLRTFRKVFANDNGKITGAIFDFQNVKKRLAVPVSLDQQKGIPPFYQYFSVVYLFICFLLFYLHFVYFSKTHVYCIIDRKLCGFIGKIYIPMLLLTRNNPRLIHRGKTYSFHKFWRQTFSMLIPNQICISLNLNRRFSLLIDSGFK
jgi:hypothetical protein